MKAAEKKSGGHGAVLLSPADALTAAGQSQTVDGSRSPDLLWCGHIGTSMNPTLAAQDLLEVEPYRDRAVRVGDVILFKAYDHGPLTVHRVVGVEPTTIVAQGDNNDRVDPWQLTREKILGRVVAAWRGTRRRQIGGGKTGLAIGVATRALNSVDRVARPWLHPLYRGLADLGLLSRLLPASLAPRVVCYRAAGQSRAQLLVGRRVIGRFDDASGCWSIRRPFRLLVDRSLLATPPRLPTADDPTAASC